MSKHTPGDDRTIAFTLNGVRVWLRESTVARREGPLMPTPTHDVDVGPFADSYAHLFGEEILRYGSVLGTFDDLVRVPEGGDA